MLYFCDKEVIFEAFRKDPLSMVCAISIAFGLGFLVCSLIRKHDKHDSDSKPTDPLSRSQRAVLERLQEGESFERQTRSEKSILLALESMGLAERDGGFNFDQPGWHAAHRDE